MERMTEFLVELYVSKTNREAIADGAERLGLAAAELTAEGRPVQLLRSGVSVGPRAIICSA